MVNKCILIGRLGKDVDIRYTQTGVAVASFSVACAKKWTDKTGKKNEKTNWISVVVWGKLAELCTKYLHKGSLAFIEGEIETRNYEAKDGTKKYITEVVAQNVRFLDSQSKDDPENTKDLGEQFDPEPGMFG